MSTIILETIEKIKEQSKEYKKFTNEWNAANQLIDIVAVSSPETAEIVIKDLGVKEMEVPEAVKKVTGQRIGDPEKVMKVICEFYGIPVPDELPSEYWRSGKTAPASEIDSFSLLDLL